MTEKKKPGPKAETLRIPGNWRDAVKVALGRGPYTGPKPNKKGGKKKGKKKRGA
jgi:hypothetical protein